MQRFLDKFMKSAKPICHGSTYYARNALARRSSIMFRLQHSKPLYRECSVTADKDLSNLLSRQIAVEESIMPSIPKFKDFRMSVRNITEITLARRLKDEQISITFDVNENFNIADDGEHSEVSFDNDYDDDQYTYIYTQGGVPQILYKGSQ